jgi:hypothetical protein
MFDDLFDWKEPYRWRTNLRVLLPRPLCWLVTKGKDCEAAGGTHEWYNIDNQISGCYHCNEERVGRFWESAIKTPDKEEGINIAFNH